jgi:hypothetical protein
MSLLGAGAGGGLARLVKDGHSVEWAVLAAAMVLGWLVLPRLVRGGKQSFACAITGGLFIAAGTITWWRGRPAAAVAACVLLAVCWLGAAAALWWSRRRSPASWSGRSAEPGNGLGRVGSACFDRNDHTGSRMNTVNTLAAAAKPSPPPAPSTEC